MLNVKKGAAAAAAAGPAAAAAAAAAVQACAAAAAAAADGDEQHLEREVETMLNVKHQKEKKRANSTSRVRRC